MDRRDAANLLAKRIVTHYDATGHLPADVLSELRDVQRRRWLAGEPVTLAALVDAAHSTAVRVKERVDAKKGRT
jgi:hypothetical protein